MRVKDFLITLPGMSSNFKCDNPKHGKIVLPEGMVLTELEVLKQKQQKVASKQHEDIQQSVPPNSQVQSQIEDSEEAILRKAEIEITAIDRAEQEQVLKEWNLKRDEQRNTKSGSNFGASVDPPDKPAHSHQNLPHIYSVQPSDRAIVPQSQNASQHKFSLNSRVQFSDPPRYGVIRWLGNFPQVIGDIAGVDLVSIGIQSHCYMHYQCYVCTCRRKTWKAVLMVPLGARDIFTANLVEVSSVLYQACIQINVRLPQHMSQVHLIVS